MPVDLHATEQLSLDQALELLPEKREHLNKLLRRLTARGLLPTNHPPRVLDVGAAQGIFVAACLEQELPAVGVEPWDQARQTAGEVAARLGLEIQIAPGTAEKLPFGDGEFDLVHAESVIEHVADAQAAFNEAFRVLRPGGVFWFHTASAMCPRQSEIRGFPLFGWYPDKLKRRIMAWAKDKRPERVGGTDTPAIHWFTPGKARRMLRQAGFETVYDRWDMRRPDEGGRLHALAVRTMQRCPATKFFAHIATDGCSYTAVKT